MPKTYRKMFNAPKYSKVSLMLKLPSNDAQVPNNKLVEFSDCGLVITGDHLIVILDVRDEQNNSLTTTGKIFNLAQVDSYQTHGK